MLIIELLPGAGAENEAPAEALLPIEAGDRAGGAAGRDRPRAGTGPTGSGAAV